MGSYIASFVSALRTVTKTVWPEVAAGGVWEVEDIERVPFEDLTPPYAVLLCSNLRDSEGGGVANHAYDVDVEFWYIGKNMNGASVAVKLETMRDYLEDNLLSEGQVMDVAELSYAATLAPNQVFLTKNMPAFAGRVTALCMVGESA